MGQRWHQAVPYGIGGVDENDRDSRGERPQRIRCKGVGRDEHFSAGFVVAVLITNLLLPPLAHDIYSHLRDEGGGSCCDDQDCRPAVYRLTARGVQMHVDQRWINVPDERIQYRALPGDRGETGGGHWCGSAYEPDFSNLEGLYVTKCAILPPQAASAQ
jgi:hypothetical protein